MTHVLRFSWLPVLLVSIFTGASAEKPNWSGIYPHLAWFNDQGECGTGAVVPWADRLWTVTYSPHMPKGSSDKLYEIDKDLNVTIRPESIGGTPANRMIHRESEQLFIGPYAIDRERHVRAIPYSKMPGRPTGNARHLTDPTNKIYYATMEEGFYEVDVHSLQVTELYRDANSDKGGHAGSLLPGYHGKGLYSGQGRLVYANNGEVGSDALRKPNTPSGCLAEWNGKDWTVVRRNQFTEVTGPGGIYGNTNPAQEPIWSIGWDHRSLLLMLREGGKWRSFRLPKASHCYDGAHGWNTEWPRIRDVGLPGQTELLMTMHGMFWRFPKTFSSADLAGIRPRSTYLKVIGDFCRWDNHLVFGCDDTAKSEFLNKRKAKGNVAGPGQSQSNVWFTDPEEPDRLGPPLGRGALWINEPIAVGEWSDPYLFAGFERRSVHIAHGSPEPVTFEFEVDRNGSGTWELLRKSTVPANAYSWVEFTAADKGEWIRVRANRACEKGTVFFTYANADRRSLQADARFNGLAQTGPASISGGYVRCRGENLRTLNMAALEANGRNVTDVGYYELDAAMKLRRVGDEKSHAWLKQNITPPKGILSVDDASVLYVDDTGKRWRLPKGDSAFDAITGAGVMRMAREVVTERDLFNAHGTFYELPAENAGGFAKIRPIATHNRRIVDYCSYRGLLVLTGIETNAPENQHIIRSEDGKAAVWVGAADDLWHLGKPRGKGGPWNQTNIKANQPSDPYLLTGHDRKTVQLSHDSATAVTFTLQVDITGDGHWVTYQKISVPANQASTHQFPDAFSAYWLRTIADRPCQATAILTYE